MLQQKVGMYQNYYTNQAAMWQKNLHYAYPTLCYMDNQVLSQNMGTFSGTKLSMMTIASVLNVDQPTIVIYLSH